SRHTVSAPRSLSLEYPKRMSKVFAVILGLFCASVATPLFAQVPNTQNVLPPAVSSAHPGVVSGFALDFLSDQKAIWTSPFHISGEDAKWLAPAGVAEGALFVFDHRISKAAKGATVLKTPASILANLGELAAYLVP